MAKFLSCICDNYNVKREEFCASGFPKHRVNRLFTSASTLSLKFVSLLNLKGRNHDGHRPKADSACDSRRLIA